VHVDEGLFVSGVVAKSKRNGFIGSMPPLETILSLVTFVLGIWLLVMARNPRFWRLWCCDLFDVLDLNIGREEREKRDRRFRIIVLVLAIGCFLATFAAVRSVVQAMEKKYAHRVQKAQGRG
jgi:hypothetical protein